MPSKLTEEEAVKNMRLKGYEPLEPYKSTDHKWKCKHKCGAITEVRHHNVNQKPVTQKCKECRKTSPDEMIKVLKEKQFIILKPEQLLGGETVKLDLIHIPCNTPITTRFTNFKNNKHQASGCFTCAIKKQGEDQRLSLESWEKQAQKANVTLLSAPTTTKKKVDIRCNECEQETETTYQTLKKGGGCSSCNISKVKMGKPTHGCGGFKKNRKGLIYLLTDKKGALKVGITNHTSAYYRLQGHRFHGWHVVKTWENLKGTVVEETERKVLSWWRNDLKALSCKTKIDMPHGGWTETAKTKQVGLRKTIMFIDESLKEVA